MSADRLIIAQISDMHVRADGMVLKKRVDSHAALDQALDAIRDMPVMPDILLATGDLVQKANKRDYCALRERLDSLGIPVYVIPGNHDVRDMMHGCFSDLGYLPNEGKFLQYTIEDLPVRIVALDSLREGKETGELCTERLAWLDKTLAEQPDRPTLVMLHHPPLRTGVSYMDTVAFVGRDEMEAIIAKNPQVERIICGHLHRSITARFGGTIVSVAPSTAFQMTLDLTPDVDSGFVMEPPGVPIFVWTPEIGIVGHMCVVGDFGPVHAFVRDPL